MLMKLLYEYYRPEASHLEKFQLSISQNEMYAADDVLADLVIKDMVNLPIISMRK